MMEGEVEEEEEVTAPATAAVPAAEEFGLPAEVMAVLPDDPFEQLDVARKITSIALASRLGRLEAEAARLRAQLAERDASAEDLRERVEQLDAALAVATGRLRRAEDEKEALQRDNSLLSNTVRRLNRDVAKLEVFKKTLMQSLQEDEDPANTTPKARVSETSNFSSATSVGDEDSAFPVSKSSQLSETASSVSEESSHVEPDVPRPPRPHVFLPSYNSTPRVTPPDSPPRSFASISPPRRHSISVTSRNLFDDRSSVYSGHHSSMTSPFDAASHTGRTRVDGKEFFRQVRNRLSYEQFSAFLANVKELNSHKQTREDTLRKADGIFGPDNKDLYTIFEGLITRNIH
uniref:At4g15545-like C-terminal domain-containing protein n=1 Tax=Oryza punctata TaxID=4537 RepID=A0A0E0L2E9_ORYPU